MSGHASGPLDREPRHVNPLEVVLYCQLDHSAIFRGGDAVIGGRPMERAQSSRMTRWWIHAAHTDQARREADDLACRLVRQGEDATRIGPAWHRSLQLSYSSEFAFQPVTALASGPASS